MTLDDPSPVCAITSHHQAFKHHHSIGERQSNSDVSYAVSTCQVLVQWVCLNLGESQFSQHQTARRCIPFQLPTKPSDSRIPCLNARVVLTLQHITGCNPWWKILSKHFKTGYIYNHTYFSFMYIYIYIHTINIKTKMNHIYRFIYDIPLLLINQC